MSTWRIDTPLKQTVAHSAGITAALTAGSNVNDETILLTWLCIAIIMEYTAAQYNEVGAVNGGWQKFVYIVSWFLFVGYILAVIAAFVAEIVRTV